MKNHIVIKFYKCRGCNKKEDIKNIINVLLANGIVLANYHKEPGQRRQLIRFTGTTEEYLNKNSREVELIDNNETPVYERSGPFRFSGTGLLEDVDISEEQMPLSFGFTPFGKEFNKFNAGLITTEEKFDIHSEFLHNIAIELYQVLLPSFGYVDYAFSGDENFFDEFPVYRTQTLYWTTFFGVDFINKYGKKYFTKSPVWRKETFPDGGILLQLSNQLSPPKDYVALNKIKEYFSPIGVNYVTYPNINLYDW